MAITAECKFCRPGSAGSSTVRFYLEHLVEYHPRELREILATPVGLAFLKLIRFE